MERKRNTSYNISQIAIFHSTSDKSYRGIAVMLNISKCTVKDIIRRFKCKNRIEYIPQRG